MPSVAALATSISPGLGFATGAWWPKAAIARCAGGWRASRSRPAVVAFGAHAKSGRAVLNTQIISLESGRGRRRGRNQAPGRQTRDVAPSRLVSSCANSDCPCPVANKTRAIHADDPLRTSSDSGGRAGERIVKVSRDSQAQRPAWLIKVSSSACFRTWVAVTLHVLVAWRCGATITARLRGAPAAVGRPQQVE